MAHDANFDEFWKRFPRKVGKLAALKAYQQARRTASDAVILAGVDAYIRHKPDYQDWCHPKTFLSQGRWMDEADDIVQVKPRVYWWDECKTLHGGACVKQWDHEMKKRDIA